MKDEHQCGITEGCLELTKPSDEEETQISFAKTLIYFTSFPKKIYSQMHKDSKK
jgi:hypothetical protein